MHAREKIASLASGVQTLLIDLKTGPLHQPTELLKIPSEGNFFMIPLQSNCEIAHRADACCSCWQDGRNGRP